jgi:acetylornithine deacetylase/succinyl-diaminopimelate desuccinylase-like protein
MPEAERNLRALVVVPSIADPRLGHGVQCLRAANLTAEAFRAAGVPDAALVDVGDSAPSVIGHRPAPAGAPTVLLYAHYDVQPPGDLDVWLSPPFELTERAGRWYGRGAADCKGNVVAHLTALRALGDRCPVGVTVLIEGAEEHTSAGLADYLTAHRGDLHADAMLIADSGGADEGVPALTVALRGIVTVVVSVRTMRAAVHSGMFGGPAPDALAALIRVLATLYDPDGTTVIEGLTPTGDWFGANYPETDFRADVAVLDGVALMGTGSVAERLWNRPAVTVLGIDCPPVTGSSMSVAAQARARVSLRVPPGIAPRLAASALTAHLEAAAPAYARVTTTLEALAAPVTTRTDGPAHAAVTAAMGHAYGRPPLLRGDGGSVPVCSALSGNFPASELLLLGVEEPRCHVHAPNESVAPGEIERIALTEARFLQAYRR